MGPQDMSNNPLAVDDPVTRDSNQLRLLIEVSEAIATHRDLRTLFRDLAKRLPAVVPFELIALFLHDPVKDVMTVHSLAGVDGDRIPPGLEVPVDESFSGTTFRTQRPVIIRSQFEAQRFQTAGSLVKQLGVESFCMIPLTTSMRPLGAMAFGTARRHAIDTADLEFLDLVVKHVAVAVDNVLHYESVRAAQQALTRERDRLQLLLEVNNAVVSRLDLEQVIASVSTWLKRVIPHEHYSLLLYEPETRRYRKHVPQVDSGEMIVADCHADAQWARTPAGIAITSRRPALFGEAELKQLATESRIAECVLKAGYKSVCSVPLLSRDSVLGALNLASDRVDAFAADDVELLGQVAQQIAIAVENGLAFREIAELKEKLTTEKLYLEDEIRTEHNFEEIIGHSSALKQVLKQVEIVAPTTSTVLIQGETGTGKELIARAIHNLSGRHGRTFVKLNCAAIPTGLLESELFGHEKGAFTGAIAQRIGRFELAHGGTLFLDEVGDIPLELQSKLLRVLQEQEFERLGGTKTIRVDVRLVAATNRDLAAMVEQKQFRSDLYYRLNVFPIANPPLRDRREDIAALVRYFTQKFSRRMNKRIESIPSEAMSALSAYHWPGNIRELENFIERAVILSRGATLDVPLAELKQRSRDASAATATAAPATTLEEAEREHIRQALHDANWQVGGASGAAARLGMKRTTLQSKMAKLGIERPRL
jgi:formate hydrogenlyase transcriptional activator